MTETPKAKAALRRLKRVALYVLLAEARKGDGDA